MPPLTLKERVALLERRLSALQADFKAGEPVRDWRKSVGMFTKDPVMKDICEAALEFREADRRRARRKTNRKPTT